MGRYFFHLESKAVYRDEDGTELESLGAARCHAVQFIAEHLCNRPQVFWENETCEVRVTDATDLTLLVVSLIATHAPAAAKPKA